MGKKRYKLSGRACWKGETNQGNPKRGDRKERDIPAPWDKGRVCRTFEVTVDMISFVLFLLRGRCALESSLEPH